ncbi:MAG: NAD(P)/FAD-dependent oxidoreductase [Fusobacteriota bacterium]
MYDVAIIGGGISGTTIFRELTKYKLDVVLIDKESDISNETTKANSAIIHGGYDADAGSLMAKFNALGNPMFSKLCKDLDVNFKRIGSLVVAFSQEEMDGEIQKLYKRGIKNGIPNMKIINQDELRKMEPNINLEAKGALYSETAGIVDPWGLAIALAENGVVNGGEVSLNTKVNNIDKKEDSFLISTNNKTIRSKYIINAAGVYADKINEMLNKPSFKINPKRGQYYIMDKQLGDLVNHVIFQCPTKKGKGVLVAPTVHGNLLIGPDAEYVDKKDNVATTADRLKYVSQTALKSSKKIDYSKTIRTFAGLRAEPDKGDFIIEESETPGFINVAGIKSPGLSSAPAIAEYVVDILKDKDEGFVKKEDFNPFRKQIEFIELSEEKQKRLIKKDPKYGRVICRCEHITEAEIINAIQRPVGATTVDGIKKRCRPGSGRCQAGFCGPRIQEILARELGKDMKDILKDNDGSYILTERTKE